MHPINEYIEVIWHDAHSEGVQGAAWLDRADIDNDPYVVRSIGILLKGVKEGHVTIAQSIAVTDGLMDSVLHIPIGMVQTIKEINL